MAVESSEKGGSKDQPRNLEQILDRLEESAEEQDRVTIDAMMEAVGRRSFGSLILVVGLIAMSPLSGIPTLPSILGIMVVLIAGQLLIGKKRFWLPQKILGRSISREKFCKGLKAVRPATRFIDRLIRPRLCFMTRSAGNYVIALICVVIGITMPPLEILPFLATTAGAALTIFGLALIARDGLLAIIGILATGGLATLAINQLLGGG